MSKLPETFFNLEQFVPSLRQQLDQHPLNLKKLIRVALQVKDPEQHPRPAPVIVDRRKIPVTDGTAICDWEVESLQSLFRGDKQPPVLGDYPEAYEDSFLLFDVHALEMSRIFAPRRDEEMKEIYSCLRRRPDGRSLSPYHDYMWQAAALILATRPLSKAEFEEIMARLERSCRTFMMGPTSRNYIETLERTIGQALR